MGDATHRNEKGQWTGSGNPAGRPSNGGWQDLATRMHYWLEKPFEEIEALDERKLSTLDALIIPRIKQARTVQGLADFNAVFDRAFGKANQRIEAQIDTKATQEHDAMLGRISQSLLTLRPAEQSIEKNS